jgi:hypothetical protein
LSKHLAIVVLSFQIDHTEQITDVLEFMDPPEIPHFAGSAHILVGDNAQDLIRWLDED